MSKLIFENQRRDLPELLERAQALASRLSSEHGVRPGTSVLFALENSFTAIELLFASWMLRARAIMLPPTCSVTLFQGVREKCAPRAVCVDSANERLRECLTGEASAVGDDAAGQVLVGRWSEQAGQDEEAATTPARRRCHWADLDALAQAQPEAIFFTSGSTAETKGVALDWSLIFKKGRQVLDYYRVTPDEPVMPILPTSHVYGLYPLLGALASGGTCVICRESSSPGEIVSTLANERVSVAICPPLTARFLFGRHAVSEAIQRHLRILSLGGAAMPPEVLDAVRRNLPQTQVFLSYGLAETYSTICCVDVSKEPERVASVGPARFAAEIEVRNPETGLVVATGEVGELCVGGQITANYDGMEDRRHEFFTLDGWLRTGDLGSVDEKGYVSIKGRLKELINAGGLSIDPREIEEALLAHPAVGDCGVFGHVRSNREYPVAGVVFDDAVLDHRSEDAVIDELYAYCRTQLSAKLVPAQIVPIERIPRNSLGKIARVALRTEVLKKMEQP